MKKLELKTSKGTFFLLDGDSDGRIQLPTDIEYQELGRVKKMSEEQFAEVVESTETHPKYWNYNLNYFREFHAKESFESLVRSLGWYLFENPYKEYDMSTWHDVSKEKNESESKTLYNPILLKKI